MSRRANPKMAGKPGYSKRGVKLGRTKGRKNRTVAPAWPSDKSWGARLAAGVAAAHRAGGEAAARAARGGKKPRKGKGMAATPPAEGGKKPRKGKGGRKKAKKNKNHIPIDVLEARLKKLKGLIKRRGGDATC